MDSVFNTGMQEAARLLGRQYGNKAEKMGRALLESAYPSTAPFESSAHVREDVLRPLMDTVRRAALLKAMTKADSSEDAPSKALVAMCSDSHGFIRTKDDRLTPGTTRAVQFQALLTMIAASNKSTNAVPVFFSGAAERRMIHR